MEKKDKTTNGGVNWKEVAIGGIAGIALGTSSTLFAESVSAENGSQETFEESINPDEEILEESVDNGYAPMASCVNDEMSFDEAFAAARAEVGPGGVFEWHGSLYGTYYASEWNAMDSSAQNEFMNSVPWHSSSHSYATNTSTTRNEDDEGGSSGGSTDGGETSETDIEIIGVEHANIDGEHDSIIGAASIDGQTVYYVDIDGTDDQFDYMMADFNGDSTIDETEVIDISDQHMSVSQFEQLANAGGDSQSDNLDAMYANNDTLPDYVNDVDPGNLE